MLGQIISRYRIVEKLGAGRIGLEPPQHLDHLRGARGGEAIVHFFSRRQAHLQCR
jgi:hypothetical protein